MKTMGAKLEKALGAMLKEVKLCPSMENFGVEEDRASLTFYFLDILSKPYFLVIFFGSIHTNLGQGLSSLQLDIPQQH